MNLNVSVLKDNSKIDVLEATDPMSNFRTLYITNAFQPSEFLNGEGKEDLNENGQCVQIDISPAHLLASEADIQRKKFGYYCQATNTFLIDAQNMAKKLYENPIVAYCNKQAELFLLSFHYVPKKLKDELRIFQKYQIEVVSIPNHTVIEQLLQFQKDKNFADILKKENCEDLWKVHKAYKKNMLQENVGLYDLLLNNYLYELYTILYNVKRSEPNQYQDIKKILVSIENIMSQCNESLYKEVEKELCVLFDEILYATKNDELSKMPWSVLMNKTCLNFRNGNYDFLKEIKKSDSYLMCDEDQQLSELLTHYADYEALNYQKDIYLIRNFMFRWYPVSSGEISLVNLFSYCVDGLRSLCLNNSNTILIIIDEIDCYLHPKWQQQILKYLLDFLNNCIRQFGKKLHIQLVVTSHSPIILSDFCKEQIIMLKYENERICTANPKIDTFGGDIWKLHEKTFFLDEGDIGDFAKDKINTVLKVLDSTDSDIPKEVEYVISHIGQPVLKRKLQEKLEDRQYEQDLVQQAKEVYSKLDSAQKDVLKEWMKDNDSN